MTEALCSVQAFGAEWRGTRFQQYAEVLHEWRGLEDRQNPQELAEHRADISRQRVLFESVSQIQQLLLASRAWAALDRTMLTRKLQAVLTGPAVPTERDAETGGDHGRNTLLELLYASIMIQRGVAVVLTPTSDLVAKLSGGHTVHIECKRPVAFDTIGTALGKLRKQCWKRVQAGAGVCVGVFGVERAYGFEGGGTLFRATDEQEARTAVESKLDDAAAHIRQLMNPDGEGHRPSRIPVIGLLFSGAMYLREPKTMIFGFTTFKHYDTGDALDTPDWLAEHL